MAKRLWTKYNLYKWIFKVFDIVDEDKMKDYLGLDEDEDITEVIDDEYLNDCAYFFIAKDWVRDELEDDGFGCAFLMHSAHERPYLGQIVAGRMYDVTDDVLDCVYRVVESGKYQDEYKKHLGESRKSPRKMNEEFAVVVDWAKLEDELSEQLRKDTQLSCRVELSNSFKTTGGKSLVDFEVYWDDEDFSVKGQLLGTPDKITVLRKTSGNTGFIKENLGVAYTVEELAEILEYADESWDGIR